MSITPEQAAALFRKHELFLYPTRPEQLVALLAEHEQQVIAGLVARAEATSVQIEAWVDAAVQDGCTTRGMLGSYVATLAYQAGFAAAQIKSRPTEGDQHEQQIRPQMDAVGGRQPVEGASTVFTGGGADLVSSITALLELDAAGALVPHGVGGHARNLLTAAAEAIAALQAKLEAAEARLAELERQEPVAWFEHNESVDAWFLAYSANPKAKTRPLFAAPGASPVEPAKRCQYCDGTGDVHTPTGEWRGECTECDASNHKGKQP